LHLALEEENPEAGRSPGAANDFPALLAKLVQLFHSILGAIKLHVLPFIHWCAAFLAFYMQTPSYRTKYVAPRCPSSVARGDSSLHRRKPWGLSHSRMLTAKLWDDMSFSLNPQGFLRGGSSRLGRVMKASRSDVLTPPPSATFPHQTPFQSTASRPAKQSPAAPQGLPSPGWPRRPRGPRARRSSRGPQASAAG